MSLYNDPILDKIKTVIDASDGGAIKKFFQGDPLVIAKSDLPCLIISKDTSEIGDESNAEDYHRMVVVLTLVSDIRQQLGDTPINIHAGSSKLYEIMEKRSSSDFTLDSASILDIIRSNTELGNSAHIDLKAPMTLDYGFTIGKRGPKHWAWEANLSFNVYFTQLR